MELCSFLGWERCAHIRIGELELYVTVEVGPRIIHFGYAGGPNLFAVHDKDAGTRGGDKYKSYGGHRLWVAPEDVERTLQPDNEAVEFAEDGESVLFRSHADRWGVQKEIRITPGSDNAVRLEQRIWNRNAYAVDLAPWGLTQMAPGGSLVIPQAPYIPPGERLLPVRPIVLWGYTRMSDPRYVWGDRVIRLRQDEAMGPTKFGALVQQGIAAYANGGVSFVKRFPYHACAPYPDFNCNFESYTRQDMLEVECLGPLETVEPGRFALLPETWHLLRETPPEEDGACADWLARLMESHAI